MACPNCNSDKTENGKITGLYGVVFEAESSAFLFPKKSYISAEVCLECGTLFNFKANQLINK